MTFSRCDAYGQRGADNLELCSRQPNGMQVLCSALLVVLAEFAHQQSSKQAHD